MLNAIYYEYEFIYFDYKFLIYRKRMVINQNVCETYLSLFCNDEHKFGAERNGLMLP